MTITIEATPAPYVVRFQRGERGFRCLHDALAHSRYLGPGAVVVRESDGATLATVGSMSVLLAAIRANADRRAA